MLKPKKYICLVLLLNILFSSNTFAHVMVAQHGTLNFVDQDVYMVLSVPVSAFKNADDNKDGKLSKHEFDRHHAAIADIVKDKIVMSNASTKLLLQGLMLSPVTPHDTPNHDASQLVVMGKFELKNPANTLHFTFNLFGETASEKVIEITAKNKMEGLKQVILFTPENTESHLFR